MNTNTTLFKDGRYFLSNMFPVEIEMCGMKFRCVESAFQAYKCANKADMARFTELDGYQAKKLGKQIKMRSDWNQIKRYVMYRLIKQKFGRDEILGGLLKAQEGEIVENNYWHDTYWGVCDGKGRNELGKILMKVRDELEIKPLDENALFTITDGETWTYAERRHGMKYFYPR